MSIFGLSNDSASSKCMKCGADIPATAKLCSECSETPVSQMVESDAASGENDIALSPSLDTSLPSEDETLRQTPEPRPFLSKRILGLGIAVVALPFISISSWMWVTSHPITAKGQYEFGARYEKGDGVPQDYSRAVYWYRKAAERGNPDAQNDLGYLYEKGLGIQENDLQAAYWYRKGAEQGSMYSQNNLAAFYSQGKGVERDEGQAVYWWRKAAEQGDAESQFNLGVDYEYGRGGLKVDESQAMKWLKKAAEQHFEGALNALVEATRLNKVVQMQSEWVSTSLNGHYWHATYNQVNKATGEPVVESRSERIEAEIDSPSSLLMQSTWWSLQLGTNTMPTCRISLDGFPESGIVIHSESGFIDNQFFTSTGPTDWQVTLKDSEHMSCPEETINFDTAEEAENFVAGFHKVVQDTSSKSSLNSHDE